MQHDNSTGGGTNRQRTISRYVFLAFAAIAAYFLITEHRAHLFGILPFLLLAACPLLHFFHHRGHKHEGGESRPDSNASTHQH
jgi:hypothetical protein